MNVSLGSLFGPYPSFFKFVLDVIGLLAAVAVYYVLIVVSLNLGFDPSASSLGVFVGGVSGSLALVAAIWALGDAVRIFLRIIFSIPSMLR